MWAFLVVENGTVLIPAMAFLCSPTMEVATSNNKIKHFSIVIGFVLSLVLVPLIIGQNVVGNMIPLHL